MPAMKPSTTSRARTSRCARRATIAGSSHCRSSLPAGRVAPVPCRAPLAVPRVPSGAPGSFGVTASVLPRGPLDDVAFAHGPRGGPRARVAESRELRPRLPAREARDVEQQLHLGLEDVAQVERDPLAAGHRPARVAELDTPRHATDLLHAIVVCAVEDLHAAIPERQLLHQLLGPAPLHELFQARMEDVHDQPGADLEVVPAAAERLE